MTKPLVDDELWAIIEPLLPVKPRRKKHPGRRPLDNRRAQSGILFVLKTGIPWEDLPQEVGCGSGMTCWRRLNDWEQAGVWQKLHEVLLAKLQVVDQLDWSRAAGDSATVRALKVANTGPNPTDRAKIGSKHHAITDAQGIPLAVRLSAANANDITQLLPVVDTIPPVRGHRGRPRRRPHQLYADQGYDSDSHRQALRTRSIQPLLARRSTEHDSGLGLYRWVIERTLSWLHQFRRLRIRFERYARIHHAFLSLACSIICYRFLKLSFC